MCEAILPFIAYHRLLSTAIACHHWHLPPATIIIGTCLLPQTLSAGTFSTFPLRSEILTPFFRDHNLHTITITTSLLPSRHHASYHHATTPPVCHAITLLLIIYEQPCRWAPAAAIHGDSTTGGVTAFSNTFGFEYLG